MNKKGSHVGVIASFAIFVLFLVGIYLVVEPVLNVQKDKQNLIDYLKVALIEEFSSNLTTVSISQNQSNCTELTESYVGLSGLDAIVKDKDGNIIDSEFNGNNLIIDEVTEPVIWVYYSDVDFFNTTSASTGCYMPTINSIRTTKEIFETKIVLDIQDFQNLESRLNVPPDSFFGLIFTTENGTIYETPGTTGTSNIYIQDIPINYLDNKANKLPGKLTIRVW